MYVRVCIQDLDSLRTRAKRSSTKSARFTFTKSITKWYYILYILNAV